MEVSIDDIRIKCVVFDFDGVILDSSGLKTECFKELYSQYKEIYEDAMTYHLTNKGTSRFKQFEYVTQNLMDIPDPAATECEMADRFAEIVFDVVSKANFITGAKELIDYLSPILPLYIISSSPHNELERIMAARKLIPYFKDYFGSVDFKNVHLKKILSQEKIVPQQMLYVGDTLKDLDAAGKAGVNFCGVKNALTDFSGHNCMLVEDLFEFKQMISVPAL